ncbi:MAG: hypothetical protein H0V70_29470 [Ktedonobacteraceae bacterium]|nr:hypothetical protein [Ktedonobacteraceae bacterium]
MTVEKARAASARRFIVEETLTIEEWKAERKLFVKQFSVNNLVSLAKEERELICESSQVTTTT